LRILELLRFQSIFDRYESIDEAYKSTFEWIFNQCPDPNGPRSQVSTARHPVWDNFLQRLHDNESLYWITGKPGCGKSTLMKYLYDDSRTSQHLQVWAPDLPLVKAGFFFRKSGTQMQMSQMGVLQTLLHEATKYRPGLVSRIFPRRWRSYQLFGGDLHPWTWSELASAMKLLASDSSTRFIFFVDGLDEFGGDAAQLAELLIEMTKSPNVKIYAANRPWLVFEEAFTSRPRLRLEDLTAPDIQHYVSGKLKGNAMFLELERQRPQMTQDLVLEVTGKACAVFLWVRLVIQSLLEGLRDGDTISDLLARLLALPSDPQELFRKILHRLNPFHFAQASRLFQTIRESLEFLCILGLSFAEDGLELALQAKVAPLSSDEVTFRVETMRRRLNSRCKGLLEVPSLDVDGPAATVQYLHRTVKDFLTAPEIWSYTLSGSAEPFDPTSALYASFIMRIKKMKPRKDMLPGLWAVIDACTKHTRSVQSKHNSDQATQAAILILDEVDSAAGRLLNGDCESSGNKWLLEVACASACAQNQNISFDSTAHWSNTKYLSKGVPREGWRDDNLIGSFLDYAFKDRLFFYARSKLDNGLLESDRFQVASMLLSAASLGETNGPDLTMVRLLLAHGVNPNQLDPGRLPSPWKVLLCEPASCSSTHIAKWLEMVILCLEHGADP
jgi:NACHT domain